MVYCRSQSARDSADQGARASRDIVTISTSTRWSCSMRHTRPTSATFALLDHFDEMTRCATLAPGGQTLSAGNGISSSSSSRLTAPNEGLSSSIAPFHGEAGPPQAERGVLSPAPAHRTFAFGRLPAKLRCDGRIRHAASPRCPAETSRALRARHQRCSAICRAGTSIGAGWMVPPTRIERGTSRSTI